MMIIMIEIKRGKWKFVGENGEDFVGERIDRIGDEEGREKQLKLKIWRVWLVIYVSLYGAGLS